MSMNSVTAAVHAMCDKLGVDHHSLVVDSINVLYPEGTIAADVRSAHPGKIFLSSEIVKVMTDEELVAICAHELGHVYHNHFLYRIGLGITSVVLSTTVWVLPIPVLKKIAIQLGLSVAEVAAQLLISRQQEFQADAISIRLGVSKGLISALKKLAARGAVAGQGKTSAIKSLLSTHPDLSLRIEKLENPTIVMTPATKEEAVLSFLDNTTSSICSAISSWF